MNEPVPVSANAAPVASRSNKILYCLIAVLFILLFIALGAIGYLFWKDNKDKETKDNSETSQAQEEVNDENEPAEDTVVPEVESKYEIFSKSISKNESTYTADITYPQIKNYSDEGTQSDFNNLITEYANSLVDNLESYIDSQSQSKNSVELDYDVTFEGKTLVSIKMSGSEFMGGAHPNEIFKTITYDLKNNKNLSLKNLFESGSDYLEVISDASVTELEKNPDADSDWISGGASAKDENFQFFYLDSDGLVIIFPPYQVAPYAMGTQTVSLDYSDLEGIMVEEIYNEVTE